MYRSGRVSHSEAVASLTEYVLELMNSLEDKADMKTILRAISPEHVQLLADAALPREYYEICQAAKEIQQENR